MQLTRRHSHCPNALDRRSRRATLNRRSGQAAILMTLAITLVCGAIGLVVDLGWAYFKKQSAQTAAEAAVLAAASASKSSGSLCGSGGLVCSSSSSCANVASGSELYVGCQYATQNGYTDGSGNQHVTISANTGTPSSAPGVSSTSVWVTATVSESVPQTFSRLTGSGSSMTVLAQATAALPFGKSQNCIYALGSSGTALTVTGGASLSLGCGIYVNSNDSTQSASVGGSSSVTLSGGNKLVSRGAVQTHGGGTISPAASQNQPAVSDPYSALQGASYKPTAGTCQPNPSGGTIGPGTYCSQITGSGNLTLTTGTYIFQNGINWSSGTLTGNNVFIYVSGGAVTTSGGAWNLTPLAGGTYGGIALYQDVADTSAMQVSGNFTFGGTGVIYAPGASMSFAGNSTISSTSLTLAASSLSFAGGASISSAATSALTPSSPGLVQ
jgi:hypothetical protein